MITWSSSAVVARELQTAAGLPEVVNPQLTYPQRALARLMTLAAARVFAKEENDEVMRRFGAAAFASFAHTTLGRIGVGLAQYASPHQIAQTVVRMHNASTKTSTLEAKAVTERGFRLHFKGHVHAWYQLGVIEAGFERDPPQVSIALEILRHAVDEDGMPARDCEFVLVVTSLE